MTPSKPRRRSPLMLLPLLASAMLCACSSPQYVPAPCPRIPPLPPEARISLEKTPSECLPTCLTALTRERESWRKSLSAVGSPQPPASTPGTR